MKKIDNAYTLTAVIFILTFLSIALLLTTFFVSFYLNNAARRVKLVSEWKPFYEILEEVKDKYFEDAIKDEYTSPFDGWFSRIPDELNGYKISCYPEDSKLDINHLDASLFFKNCENESNSNNNIIFEKGIDNYIYYKDDLNEYIIKDASSDIDLDEYLSIYNVPNLNTVSIDRLELFLRSQNYDDSFISNFINKIKHFRGAIKDYLRYPLTKTGIKEGLIINKSEYESLNELNWGKENFLFKFFDYKGRINLNFVNEKVFSIAFNACSKDKKEDYKQYWDKISRKQKEGSTIKDTDYDKIFGTFYLKVGKQNILIKRWLYFEKIFGVDSNLFQVDIIKNSRILTAYLRKYKIKETKIKTLKISVGKYEEKK